MEDVVLGLGSNRSFGGKDPVALLAQACTALTAVLGDCAFSSVYKTGALYVTDQDDFYNMAVLGKYAGTPRELLEDVHIIEGNLGRDRAKEFRNGPRPLDIDIELFGNVQVHEADLIIPHERLMERAFVLKPVVEILRNSADGRSRDNSPSVMSAEADMTFEATGGASAVAAAFANRTVAFYEHALGNVKDQRIEKFLDSTDFMALLEKTDGSLIRKA